MQYLNVSYIETLPGYAMANYVMSINDRNSRDMSRRIVIVSLNSIVQDEILTQFGGSSRAMIYRGCVTIEQPLSECAIECERALGRSRSGGSGGFRKRGGGQKARGAASLDQVSSARRHKERSPPLPVLSVHTIFYLADTITSFNGPDPHAKVVSPLMMYNA